MSYRDLYRWLFLMPLGFFLTMGLFLAFIISPMGGWLVRHLPEKNMTRFEIGAQRFDAELARFDAAPAPRNVIVGPSYAEEIGPISGFYNLGLASAAPAEVAYIIEKYCSPSDRIYYVCTVRDALANHPTRPLIKRITNTPYRRLTLAKTLVHPYSRITDISREAMLRRHNQMYSGKKISIQGLTKISQSHKHITFILHPFLAEHAYGGVKISNKAFKTQLHNSDLCVCDFSDALAPPDFRNFNHLTDSGLERFRLVFGSPSPHNSAFPEQHS